MCISEILNIFFRPCMEKGNITYFEKSACHCDNFRCLWLVWAYYLSFFKNIFITIQQTENYLNFSSMILCVFFITILDFKSIFRGKVYMYNKLQCNFGFTSSSKYFIDTCYKYKLYYISEKTHQILNYEIQ